MHGIKLFSFLIYVNHFYRSLTLSSNHFHLHFKKNKTLFNCYENYIGARRYWHDT
jgi:hypothetical protein